MFFFEKKHQNTFILGDRRKIPAMASIPEVAGK
jgi:hypothetical protein